MFTLEQRKAIGFVLEKLDILEPFCKTDLLTVLRPYQPVEFQFGDSISGYYRELQLLEVYEKRDIVMRILSCLKLDEIPLPIFKMLRSTLMIGLGLCDDATCVMLNIVENVVRVFSPLLIFSRTRIETEDTLDIRYENVPYEGNWPDEKDLQSSIAIQFDESNQNNLIFMMPSGFLKVLFSDLKWCQQNPPGSGYYQSPSDEQVGFVVKEFIAKDSIREDLHFSENYDLRPQFKFTYGGALVMRLTNIVYAI